MSNIGVERQASGAKVEQLTNEERLR